MTAPTNHRREILTGGQVNRRLTAKQFDRLVAAAELDSPSIPACRLVLVGGVSINAAAREIGVDPGGVSRMLKKIPREVCPHCKLPVPR
jgi:DNA-binding MarR family transcriptional regulator